MIDPADKLTQSLPLDEQPAKRKRGRPATGKAMTPAEKQRAYRERQRQKAAPELGLKGALENWETACRNLGAANDRVKALEDQVQRLQTVRDELIFELREARKELESRYEKSMNQTAWHFEYKVKGARSWKRSKSVLAQYEETEMRKYITDMNKNNPGTRWRAVSDEGLIYDPKAQE